MPSVEVAVVDISMRRNMCVKLIQFLFLLTLLQRLEASGAGKAADLTYWESAARMIADVSKSGKIGVEKSTVPVKNAEAIERILTHNSNNGINFQNPLKP
ncbi:hypothetical protein H5410_014944 [Solanum commersonii]|uniref:UDP-glucose/GDP-mannose dehydrogenase N-terminal domain-containing protein n=1 Tax=Solanum commersonii TaxID=4109 RepID=A0A9J5ZSG2_SOLCO|nr:hypothetical protein H5410_014944 [Solanum commersonii]